MHPRTEKTLDALGLKLECKVIEPVGYLDILNLLKNCSLVMTDSGGLQKEAFYFEKPCVILRAETEWVELVECGTAIVADADESKIKAAFEKLTNAKGLKFPSLYGDGHAAEFICKEMLDCFSK